MKKDSFTFSDKLKKSKTLPLSKRIPSRVGGEVKAKRTLFERAQRDLPFIIVAALALLLLPFLSRESVDIDTPSGVWGNGGDEYIEDFNKPESAEGEIALSSFRNPLDLIIRPGDKDDSARYAIDTEGAGEEDSSGYGSSTTSTYGSEEYSPSPATSRYGKTVKRSVRNSVNRVPTAIGSLSRGAMVSTSGGGAPSHSFAFGGRPTDGAPKVQGPGVRPVALQPLAASGKGRNLAGSDALYAEAARSIGAMNTPGAKQALFDSQLADIDGKPLGDTKGAGGPGAGPNRPGASGNLANNWNHSPLKPWWWDMMKQRSQMRWELWHYNWEKMASDSLIKLTAGLASCLIAGSPDFSVGHFLGTPGTKNYKCFDADGKPISSLGSLNDWKKYNMSETTTKDGGKEQTVAPNIINDFRAYCKENGGYDIRQTDAGHDSWFETRLNCLGISLDNIKDKYENRRSATCINMYGDPMQVNISAERNGKDRVKQYRKMGYYVMGKKGDQECAAAIDHAIPGINEIPYKKGMTKVVIYRVGATGMGFFPEGNADPTFDRNLDDYKNKKGNYNSEEEIYWESGDYYRGLREAEKRIQNAIDRGECLSEKRVQEILKTYGKWRTSSNSMGRFNQLAYCPVPDNRLYGTLEPLRINTRDGSTSTNSSPYSGIVCNETMAYIPNAGGWHAISATIKNPGPRTVAVVIEEIQGGETASKDYFKNGESTTVPERSGYLIKEVIDFRYVAEKNRISETKTDENGEEYKETTFASEFQVGLSSTTQNDAKGERKLARAGHGYVLWITTDDLTSPVFNRNTPVYGLDINSVMQTKSNKGYASGICNYIWGCGTTNDCINLNKNYCKDESDGKIYKAVQYRDYLFRASKDPIVDQDVTFEVLPCEPICKHKEGGVSIVNQPGSQDPLPNIDPITQEEIDRLGIWDKDCPFCNPKNKIGMVCVDPERQGEYCPCIKVDNPITPARTPIPGTLYIRSEVDPIDDPQQIELPVTPICAKKAIALGNIFVRNPDGTAGEQVNPDNEIVAMLKDKSPEDQHKLCPFCNPGDDEGKGKCYIGKDIYPSVSFIGEDGKTYHIRTSQRSTDGTTSYPCTPICAAKAKALGIFETEGIDSEAPVDPNSPLTRNEGDINPVKPGTPLCPYCNPDPAAAPEQPEFRDIVIKPCEVQLIGEYFWNASYELKVNLPLEKIYEVMHDCDDPIIEGHASKTVVTDDGKNNNRLSFDRAMEVARQVQGEWARHGVNLQVTPTSDGLGRYYGVAPDRYWVKYRSWPKQRNTITNPSNPDETVKIYGVGDKYADFTRPALPRGKKAWPADQEADYRLKESKDRKVIIKGTVRH